MSKHFFDYDDGDFAHTISDNMAIDSDGNMMMRMGDNIRKRSARQPQGNSKSRGKGFAFGYGLISSVVSQYFSSFAFCFSDRDSISSALLRDCRC